MRRSAENRLSDALETSREGVILVASGGAIVLANRQLREFFPAIADSLVSGTVFSDALRLIQSQLRYAIARSVVCLQPCRTGAGRWRAGCA